MADFIPLRDVVRYLRNEIIDSISESADDRVSFAMGEIEIELNVVAKRTGEGKGEVKFDVLGIGASVDVGGNISREHVQKVKFKLQPNFFGRGGVRNVIFNEVKDEVGSQPKLA